MASALKNIQSNSNSYNLVNSYNNLVEGLGKHKYKNFIKNNKTDFIVKNDLNYDLGSLDLVDEIDKTKFSLSYWYHSVSENNSDDVGMLLSEATLAEITKDELNKLHDIPVILDTTNKISQEISVELRKQTDYVIAVEYQIKNIELDADPIINRIETVATKNLTISLEVDDGSSYIPLNSSHFTTNDIDYKIANSSNYTYQKLFIIKNLNEYNGDTNFKLTLGGSIDDDNLNIIIKSTSFYEGNILIPSLANNDSIEDFINFEDKVWRLSNDGYNFTPINNTNLITVGLTGKYSTLNEALSSEISGSLFFLVSDVNLNNSSVLGAGCSIYGNGFSINTDTSILTVFPSEKPNSIKDVQINGGTNNLRLYNTDNVTLENIVFNEIVGDGSSQLYILNSNKIVGRGLKFINNNLKASKCVELSSSSNCDLSINSITNYGYENGLDMSGSGVYLINSDNNRIYINSVETEISSSITTSELNAVEEVSSNNNNITILNHNVVDNNLIIDDDEPGVVE